MQKKAIKMTNLIYYRNEKIVFKTAFEKKMSVDEAEIVFSKLVRHFKLGQVYLNWTSGRNHPRASKFPRRVTFNVDWNNFGVLCHEVAHIKQIVKGNEGHNWHNKKHLRFMKGMIAYCERKNYFVDELQRRLAPKPQKPELTKVELQQREITKTEAKIKKYETKIKRYQRKLAKTNKKLVRLKKRFSLSI